MLRKHFFGCCVEVVVELVVVDALCAIPCCWERMLDILTAIGIETINNKKGSAENKSLTISSSAAWSCKYNILLLPF